MIITQSIKQQSYIPVKLNINPLPYKIKISNSPRKQSLKYFIPFVIVFWVSSFAFSGKIPYGMFVGFGAILLGILVIIFIYKKDENTKRSIELSEEGILEIKKYTKTFISWKENHQTYLDSTQFSMGGIIPLGSVVSTQVVAKGKRIGSIFYPLNTFHESILSLSHKYVFPLIQKQIQDGERVYFGPIELDKTHIYIKNNKYDKTDIQKIKVENGKVILKLRGDGVSTSIMIRDIPNFYSLIELIQSQNSI